MRVHSFTDTTLTFKLMRSSLNKVALIRGYRVLLNVKCKRGGAPMCKHVHIKIHYVQMSYTGFSLKIMSLLRSWHIKKHVEKLQ